jgi:8-oxo-dGTP pyrophosphatase MutT (NUDIX family)
MVVTVAGSSDPATVRSGSATVDGQAAEGHNVKAMPRPVPQQVIPRPADWRLGDPAPWADLAPGERSHIPLSRVRVALGAYGQSGPVPAGIAADRVLGLSVLINESFTPDVRVINSAVLVALFEEAGEARVILTRRSSGLRSHRGEVSFPGGRLDEGEDPPGAALREAHEEIALDPGLVTEEGWIHPVLTVVSGSLIMPIVASVPSRPHVVASPAEVERVFDVSLRELAADGTFHEERWRTRGRQIPGTTEDSFPIWFFEVAGEMIWGATARMLHELMSVVLVPPG